MNLTEQTCKACEGDTTPLSRTEAKVLLEQVPEWKLADDATSISRAYTFGDFAEALAFVNRVGELAEAEGHHPDIHLTSYKHVSVELSTHAIGGLSENDFILAAKIEALEASSQ